VRSKEFLWTITIEILFDFFNPKIWSSSFLNLWSSFSRFQKLLLAEVRYIQRLRTCKALALSGPFIAPQNPILVFHFFSVGNLGCLQCKSGLKMCPLGLKIIFKVWSCEGDHVDISNFAGSSDSAKESSILLNQMVLAGCVPCTLNTPLWCENVSVDCQTCLIGSPLSRRSCGYFKLWSGDRWRREPA